MEIKDIAIISSVSLLVLYAVVKEVKALLSLKKMPEFINQHTKPVIANSIILTVADIVLTILSFLCSGSYWFYIILLVASLIGMETISFIDTELHNVIEK